VADLVSEGSLAGAFAGSFNDGDGQFSIHDVEACEHLSHLFDPVDVGPESFSSIDMVDILLDFSRAGSLGTALRVNWVDFQLSRVSLEYT
jgi:hypothetical protein